MATVGVDESKHESSIVQSPEQKKTLARIMRLIDESDRVRTQQHIQWDENLKRFQGDHWIKNGQAVTKLDGLTYAVSNRTQNSTMAHGAIQSETDPRVEIKSRKQREPSNWFVRPEAGARIAAAIDDAQIVRPENLTDEQIRGDQAIPDKMAVEQLRAFTSQWQDQNGNTRSPLLENEDLIEVSDRLAAEVFQVVHDVLWDKSDTGDWLWDHRLKRNIIGHQPAMYEFDTSTMTDKITDLHVKNVWIDPIAEGIDDAEYIVVLLVISKEKAISLYPDLARTIKEFRGTGTDRVRGMPARGGGREIGGVYTEHDFDRDMIDIWIAWERFREDFPMDPIEAQRLGKVVEEPEGGRLPQTGEPVGPMVLFTADRFGNPLERTAPNMPNWPTKRGIIQTKIVADTVVSEKENIYSDIPILWSKNIPEIYRPYSQGEPERLKHIDDARNRILSSFIDYIRMFRSLQEIMPASVADLVGDKKLYTRPDRKIVLPDEMYEKLMRITGGKLDFTQNLPEMSAGYIRMWELLTAEHEAVSENEDVLGGRLPAAGTSGVALDTLQQAARGVIAYKANSDERSIRRLAMLRMNAIRDFMPLIQIQRIVGRYPMPVIQNVLGRSAAKDLDFDLVVEIASGGGSTRRFQQLQMMELRRQGDRSRKGLYEALDLGDADVENRRLLEEQGLVAPDDGPVAPPQLPGNNDIRPLLERPGQGVPEPAARREGQLTASLR